MRYAIAAALIAVATPAAAIDMRCKNPRREYNAVYNTQDRRFFVDEYEYSVLAVEDTSKLFVVAGTTIGDGPAFRAEFRPKKQIQFFSDSKLTQTDKCR